MPFAGRNKAGVAVRWHLVTCGPPSLPPLADQAERLVALGLAPDPDALRLRAEDLADAVDGEALLVLGPRLAPPSVLAPSLRLGDRAGFVVTDMTDVDEFGPVDGLIVPDEDVYAVVGVERGDDLANWSPEEVAPELAGRGRTPLTLAEGLHWALQVPDVIDRNHCFMTIGSRLRKPTGRYDSRTPALWISNGTGRDGAERRGAPKVGWCWWRNRHTWLGFASAASRVG